MTPSAKLEPTVRAALDREQLGHAVAAADAAGAEHAERFAGANRRQRLTLVTTYRRQLLPRRKPGRRRSASITAAHADWKAGMHGVALYSRHIPGFRKMGYWKKKDKIRILMDAIRKREYRRTNPKAVLPTKPLA